MKLINSDYRHAGAVMLINVIPGVMPKNALKETRQMINCGHPKDKRYTKVLESTTTCEKTVTACLNCGAWLDEPKNDCR
jgi:recombinational DNA repair protein RecR